MAETTQVLTQFALLEELEAVRAAATQTASDYLESAHTTLMERMQEFCADPEVQGWLIAASTLNVDFVTTLKSEGLLGEDTAAAILEAPERRLARRFMPHLFETESVPADAVAPAVDSPLGDETEALKRGKAAARKLFLHPAQHVADNLKGKVIRVGDRSVVIANTLAQDAKFNEKWLSDPMFGKHRPDVSVGRSRQYDLIYLRAGAYGDHNSCVRVISARQGDVACTSADAVCKALGLSKGMTGDLIINDAGEIEIVNLQQPEA